MSGAAVEGFELGVFPEKFWGIEDIAVKVDEVALNEDLSHFAGDLFAGKGDFASFGQIDRELFSVVDRFLDDLFKCGQFY